MSNNGLIFGVVVAAFVAVVLIVAMLTDTIVWGKAGENEIELKPASQQAPAKRRRKRK